MKLTEMRMIEDEVLRARAISGDNEAAAVLLAHLREISKAIENWKSKKEEKEREKA